MESPNIEVTALTEQPEVTPVSAIAPTMLTDSKQLNTLSKVADRFAQSSIVPETFQKKPADCFVACEIANRMGVSPLMVMQNLYVVNGKPAWGGSACVALINGTRRFSPIEFVFSGTKGEPDYGCYVCCVRLSDGAILKGTEVTMTMAEAEGWLSKKGSKWLTMPEQMIQYRAAAFFARVYCPEALMGFQTADEVRDVSGYEQSDTKRITFEKPKKDEVVING